MTQKKKIHQIKTTVEFENEYWYASELKEFARDIGVPNSYKLRKDQLEDIIKGYIENGTIVKKRKSRKFKSEAQDILGLNQKIKNYVSNKETKSFIIAEAQKIYPNLPKKSGVWYWTNRWREEQTKKRNITYRELIQHFVKLSTRDGRLPQIPSARFNNFITDFLNAGEGSREEAMATWELLKSLDIPKTYAAGRNHNA